MTSSVVQFGGATLEKKICGNIGVRKRRQVVLVNVLTDCGQKN